MITLLASIAGFITSIIPEFFKFLMDKSDKKHELEIMDRQIELQKQTIDAKLQEIRGCVDIAETKALYTTFKSGIFWTDALNASVRPVLAYCFFLLYGAIKYLQFKSIATVGNELEIIEILWTVDDQAIFAGIISFYFGQRAMRRRYGIRR